MSSKNGSKLTLYTSGAVRSDREGKGRYDLIPSDSLQRLAVHYERGAKRLKELGKDEDNWTLGFPLSRCLCSAIGHLYEYLGGNTSTDHLAAAAWQVFCAMHFEEGIKEGRYPASLNDIPGAPIDKTPTGELLENASTGMRRLNKKKRR